MAKGRKPNKSANRVFSGVVRRSVTDPLAAFLEVKYNDSEGVRRTQGLLLKVVDNEVQAVPAPAEELITTKASAEETEIVSTEDQREAVEEPDIVNA